MSTFYIIVALVILLTVLFGMIQVWRAKTRADQMLSALLIGTAGVAILLLLAAASGRGALVDVALVFAMLALVITVAFVRSPWAKVEESDRSE